MAPSTDHTGPPATRRPIRRLIGVYHANGSIPGELAYWIGARLGRSHCALCDITHGTVREKRSWKACRVDLPVPFETVHLDERDPELVEASDGRTPCVIAETDAGLQILIDAEELGRCQGSPECLVDTIGRQADASGLRLGGSPSRP